MRIEKDWITAAGLRAVIVAQPTGIRCGYVGVSEKSCLYGRLYTDPLLIGIQCHGGLTYAGPLLLRELPVWWFGFDCDHMGDAPDPEAVAEEYKYLLQSRYYNDGFIRTLDYCIAECESIAAQLFGLESC